ncbi:hypothetical protein [Symbiobacterium terraclitae]|uniref:hypothetical protein n=1 Tax=Symbiobacterium terraclitae TaxID=557451 RepID=UPI0035B56715
MQLTEQQRAELERRMEHLRLRTDQVSRWPEFYLSDWANSVLAVLESLASALQGKEGER